MNDIPKGVGTDENPDLLLKHGIEVQIPDVSGSPTIIAGTPNDPLEKLKYHATFVGIDGVEMETTVKIDRKIYFDGTTILIASMLFFRPFNFVAVSVVNFIHWGCCLKCS